MFKEIFLLFLIKSISHIISLLICFLFLDYVSITLIAYINLYIEILPFLILCLTVFFKIKKLKNPNDKNISLKDFSQKSVKYGLPITFNYLTVSFWREIQLQGIGIFFNANFVTGYNIGLSYSNISSNVLTSLATPLITSFSRFQSGKKKNAIVSVYNQIIKYSQFFLLLLCGILWFAAETYLFFIYGQTYTDFAIILKLLTLSIIFDVLCIPFDAFVFAREKTKLIAFTRVVMFLLNLLFFFTGLFFLGIIGALLGIIISKIFKILLYAFSTKKFLKINLKYKSIIIQYITFFISIILNTVLKYLFINIFNDFLLIFFFFIIFLILTFLLKTFNKKDIRNIKIIFPKFGKRIEIIFKV
jgi:O-antigen/teichoic acid export membrane protein